MKKFTVLLAGVAISTTNALAQSDKLLRAATVPNQADAAVLFAPRGWKIQDQINGDLNRDKLADVALVLVENKPTREPRQRALVVAVREGKGLLRVGFNNSLLLGTRDGGAFYGVSETPVNVAIRNGVLIVNQNSGSREVTETTHKFRFDGQHHMMLIGFDSVTRDRLDGSAHIVSTNYLRGRQHITDIAARSGRKKSHAIAQSHKRRLRPLEVVKIEDPNVL